MQLSETPENIFKKENFKLLETAQSLGALRVTTEETIDRLKSHPLLLKRLKELSLNFESIDSHKLV